MKFLTISLAFLMSLSLSAAEFEGFRVENVNAKKASVYLVAGSGVYSNFTVSKVFKKIGTFNSDGGVVEVPATQYDVDDNLAPKHVLVVTHNSQNHALNKAKTNDFNEPEYKNYADRVAPNSSNVDYVQRGTIHFKRLDSFSRIFTITNF